MREQRLGALGILLMWKSGIVIYPNHKVNSTENTRYKHHNLSVKVNGW